MKKTTLSRAILLGALLQASLAAAAAPAEASDGFAPAGAIEVWHTSKETGETSLLEVIPNIVPAAMRSYLLRAGYAGGAQISVWYIAPFINAVDPSDALTAANFNATLGEFTNYTESTRPLWAQETEASQAIVNGTTLATITIGTGGGTINGIVLASVSTKGSSAGTLAAATRFGSERAMQEGDTLQFRYTMQANLPA